MSAESGAMATEAAEMGGLVVAESHEASARVGGLMKWRLAQSACFCVMCESGSTSELEDAKCGDTTSARPGMTMVRPM